MFREEDGLSAYERIKGQKPSVPGIEFGAKILFMKHAENGQQKIKSRIEKWDLSGGQEEE